MNRFNEFLPIGLCVALLGLSSCSGEEEPQGAMTYDDNAIRFAAGTEYARGGDVTTNNLTSFNVYAYTGMPASPTVFMDNVTVSKTGNNVWTYSPVKYWPAKETVDFYAFSPASWVGDGGPLKPVSYNSYPGTEDIVYAVSPGLSGNAGEPNAQVVFNFRHALAKVTVKMSSTNENLSVRVTNVVLNNIRTKGNFTFPSASTAGTVGVESTGKWSDQNTPMVYVLHMSSTKDEIITLTSTPTDMSETGSGFGGAKYMVPQELTWRSGGFGNDTFIGVMCSVYDSKTGVKLWPNDNTPSENVVEGSTFGDGILKFPLSTSSFSAWEPGCHYIYSLVINSNEEMGAIEFGNPTVDTYVDVTTTYE